MRLKKSNMYTNCYTGMAGFIFIEDEKKKISELIRELMS